MTPRSPMNPASIEALTELASAIDPMEGLKSLERAWSLLGEDIEVYRPLLKQLIKRVQEVHQLRELAGCDALTGVGNRRGFQETLDREVARAERTGSPFAIVMLDLDGMKSINDQLGHSAGDRALTTVAKVASRTLRTSDYIARLGGDEFAIILPDTPRDSIDAIVERLRSAIESSQIGNITLRTSIGSAVADRACSPAGLVAEADANLYRDKRSRNEHARANTGLHARMIESAQPRTERDRVAASPNELRGEQVDDEALTIEFAEARQGLYAE